MKYNVLGIEKVDYVSKKTGQPVRGTNLHCSQVENPDHVDGIRVERLYVPERVHLGGLSVGDDVDVYFNRYGSVDTVSF